ncbi:SH3 domain-containing kinase-binding protein 1-like [Cylas formicarius]|uniref:SH3 domain-containing kinase-binding protein 1-like n=1 Tax=Cylas formicarius TaxID=197179 RepID=UPI00295832A8|nr:SH3 domain-containing kinase-binding protein 1-like [Cylas formicarius]
MVEVIVEYDYSAKQEDELTLKKGDVIKNVVKKSGGWWEGTLNDKKGMFPDNFVRVMDNDSVVLRNKKDLTRIRQCKVDFSYDQEHEDELTLKVGDVIDIIGEAEDGWWRGILNGKEGVFPSNFVTELPPLAVNKPRPSLREDLKIPNDTLPLLPRKPAKQLCEVKYSYKAQNDDELTLKEGDIVVLLSKDGEDPGWWKGELNGKVGVFPDNFVVLLPGSDDKKPINVDPAEIGAIKPSSVASQRKSLEVKSEKPLVENKTPPLPGKKPIISLKKSPSASGVGLFSKIKDKLMTDAPDGSGGSKPKTEPVPTNKDSGSGDNVFDQVERRSLLSDVRANRARAPGRRLPTSIYKEDDEEIPGLPNGNVDHHNAVPVGKAERTVKPDSGGKSESIKSEPLDSSSSSELDAAEAKPKLREWEKHKAPWLEEMKLNQAKRTSTSPGPEPKHKLSSAPEPKSEPEVSKSSQSSPAEKEFQIVDMSKSMSDIKTSPVEVLKPSVNPKTSPGELEKTPSMRYKPYMPAPPVSKPPVANLPARDQVSKPASIPPQPKLSPKPSFYENAVLSKAPVATEPSTEATVSLKNFNDVLERLSKLEAIVERQAQAIDDLKNRLQVESDMRVLLQEKMSLNNVQV